PALPAAAEHRQKKIQSDSWGQVDLDTSRRVLGPTVHFMARTPVTRVGLPAAMVATARIVARPSRAHTGWDDLRTASDAVGASGGPRSLRAPWRVRWRASRVRAR